MSYMHAFLCGFCFIGGILVGITAAGVGNSIASRRFKKDFYDNAKAVEDRLKGYVVNTERIAIALEQIVEKTP